jgi:hypothetical protein
MVGWSPGSDSYYQAPEPTEEEKARERARVDRTTRPAYLRVDSEEEWRELAKPQPSLAGAADGVKFVLDHSGAYHFLNTRTYPLHYQYCKDLLGEKRCVAARECGARDRRVRSSS